jgi:RAQPRD family integrative conjugative element protein
MKNIVKRCFVGALMMLSASNAVIAQESETEKRYLIAITTEIDNLKSLAQKAEATADKNERLQFNYSALQRDLAAMQQAVEQHVKAPSRSPRKIEALTTQYTRPVRDESAPSQ